jgi:hypothetical protein
VRDLHIGVISSNMGDLGGGSCEYVGTPADKSHLRTLGSDGPVATYQDLGFLAWDPDGELSPAGESDFEALVASAVDIVSGMGEQGCGYEMPLEAMNRFLVDPAPYDALVRDNDGQHGSGIDEALLAERAASSAGLDRRRGAAETRTTARWTRPRRCRAAKRALLPRDERV